MDTICALASARGKAGVAVIRLSGPTAWMAVKNLAGDLPAPRRAGLRRLRESDGRFLDDALVIGFEAGASFTGEEVAELHLHGSPAVVHATLSALCDQGGVRMAEPGEFTRRAFMNGRMELDEVEGLADLIESETDAQRRLAERSLTGALRERAEGWREQLVEVSALAGATIDFGEDVSADQVAGDISSRLRRLDEELVSEIAGTAVAERLRDGFEVAIIGRPNIGKSTLLNRLVGREAAITSEISGTTRDVIEVRMDIDGLPVTILDTAGLRDSGETLERIGVTRAVERGERADLRIFLVAPGECPAMEPKEDDIVATGKGDLHPDAVRPVSGITGLGVEELLSSVGSSLGERVGEIGAATQLRQAAALEDCLASVRRAQDALSWGSLDLVGAEIDGAAGRLAILTGRIDVEDVLDRVFSRFCLGK